MGNAFFKNQEQAKVCEKSEKRFRSISFCEKKGEGGGDLKEEEFERSILEKELQSKETFIGISKKTSKGESSVRNEKEEKSQKSLRLLRNVTKK